MKLTSLVLASVVSAVAVASAPSTGANISAALIPAASNSSQENISPLFVGCDSPANYQLLWWYNTRSDGLYSCYGSGTSSRWSMLKSYRSGGFENVHWKYTDDPRDNECLVDWDYYDEDGTSLIITVRGRTTLAHDTRRWCAVPVYRTGGVKGKQWEYCRCYNTK